MKRIIQLVVHIFFIFCCLEEYEHGLASGYCSDILWCSLGTGYYCEDEKFVDIFVSPLLADEIELCASEVNVSNIFCGIDDINRISIKSVVNSRSLSFIDHAVFGLPDELNPQLIHRKRLYTKAYYLHVVPSRPKMAAKVNILDPGYGFIFDSVLNVVFSVSKSSKIVSDTRMHILFNVIDVASHKLAGDSRRIWATDVEPASWFFSLTPTFEAPFISINSSSPSDSSRAAGDLTTQDGYTTHGYVEITLSSAKIRAQRVFSTSMNRTFSATMPTQLRSSDSLRSTTSPLGSSPKILCIWGSNKMDGQRSIWIQQIKHFDPARFTFVWIIPGEDSRVGTVRHILNNTSNVKFVLNPFQYISITFDELQQDPGDGAPPASEVWDGNEQKLYAYMGKRFEIAMGNITEVTPPWVASLYESMRAHMAELHCDLVIYGNDR